MRIAATILIALVAALHLYFLVLEMFLWRTPFGRRTFGTTAEAALLSPLARLDEEVPVLH